ncbi:hypothetical protein LQ327_01865 [Actinomycetospora endophytica]|uniref:Secreted protein n=1 Tax=Actinomycetospora endophytica TaxID=2291215 RepID=A0ABS8P227_9PSEU|nr:hypothetical protein [Actinomycetospora endophytica]MCD2192139.1 hypothetical protein [Actinomycetospora endophytica]
MTLVIVVIVVVVVLALAGGGLALARRKRSEQLQEQFGPEYDRAVEQADSKGEAEKELAERRKRHDQLELLPLDPQTAERFRGDWMRIQGEFVDDPGGAVEKADSLVTTIMRERGYPVDDFDQRAADISVEHPRVVEHYREARRVHDAHRESRAGTEDLREAVTSYRSLVDALIDESPHDDGHGGGSGEDGRHRAGESRPHDDGGRRDDDGRRRDDERRDDDARRDDGGRHDRGDAHEEREAGGSSADGARDHDGSRR